jgi:hypothetical protein
MKSQAQPIHSGRRSFGRSVARLTAISAAICVLLLLALSLWNLAAAKWQHERNPVPGSFYAVEGLQMHIDCSGTGSPAVIMEAAASAPWSLWRKAQPDLSQITRVCSYDRAGHGWSEPRKGQRDAVTIVIKGPCSRRPPNYPFRIHFKITSRINSVPRTLLYSPRATLALF